jgi:hypothetical protein
MTTRITVYARNIPASTQEAFEIRLNEEEFFDTKQAIGKNETVTLFADVPSADESNGEELIVNLHFVIPIKGIDATQEFNITQNGPYIMIQLVPNGDTDRLSLRQTHKDTFNPNNQQQQQQQENNDAEMTVSQYHLSNIPASATQPFELILNNKVVFRSVDDMSTEDKQGKIAIVTAKFPKPKLQDHVVPMIVRVPAILGAEEKKVDLNYSRDGCFVKVYVDENGQLDVWQSHDDNFKQKFKPQEVKNQKPQIDYIKEIEALASLRDAGILSNEEFEQKKKKLLGL